MPYLDGKGSQYNRAKDGVSEDAIKHIPLTMDLTGIYFVEELHHDKGVKDDCVVLRWRRVQWGIAATVNVKDLLSCSRHI